MSDEEVQLVHVGEKALDRASPALVYLDGLAASSRPAMRGALKHVALMISPTCTDWMSLPWHTLRYEEVRLLRRKIIDAYPKAGSTNVHLAALRGILKVSWKMGLLEDFYRLREEIKNASGKPLHVGIELTKDEVRRLLEIAEPRDAALIAVLHGAGLRRIEASRLSRKDYDGKYILAFGKRNKERRVPLLPRDRPILDKWCATLPGDPKGPLLPRMRDGKPTKDKLTVSSMNRILEALRKQSGIRRFSPHDFRRGFATSLLEAGVDISVVQDLMGHSDINTTKIYDKRGERAMDAAMNRLDEFLCDD